MRLMIGESSAMRPCKVRDNEGEHRALFHCWSKEGKIVEPSMMRGGHQGGVVNYTVGIVELEDGKVCLYFPQHIRFLDTDNIMSQYCYDEDFKRFMGD